MEDLLILVQLIQNSKFKTDGLLNMLLEPNTQMRYLYDGLALRQVQNDEEALREITALGNSASILATVKSKLKERLTDALPFVEFNDTEPNDRQKAYLECVKKWAATTVFLSKNYRDLGIQKLEQLLRYTRRFEFTQMTTDVLQALRSQSGLIYGNGPQYREYSTLLEQYQNLRNKEEIAETTYTDLIVDFVNNKSDKRELAEHARARFREIEPYLLEYDSYRLQFFGRMLQIAIYDNQNDYQRVIQLCEEAIAFFDGKPYRSTSALQGFYYSLFMGYINLRQYDRCRVVANQYRNIFQTGTYNWFKWQELYFLAELHAGEYETAIDIWYQVMIQPEYSELPSYLAESWKIFEAYIVFLVRCGRIRERKGDKKTRLAKIWNELHVISRDKTGMNIPILVIQFLLDLSDKEYDQCIDRQESLAKYRTRYLKPATAARSHYFFKMLELIPRSKFDAATLRVQAAPLLKQLSAIPLEAANQNFEVEIIPYETLWEIAMTLLSTSAASRTPRRMVM